jgi:hypothetical protein
MIVSAAPARNSGTPAQGRGWAEFRPGLLGEVLAAGQERLLAAGCRLEGRLGQDQLEGPATGWGGLEQAGYSFLWAEPGDGADRAVQAQVLALIGPGDGDVTGLDQQGVGHDRPDAVSWPRRRASARTAGDGAMTRRACAMAGARSARWPVTWTASAGRGCPPHARPRGLVQLPFAVQQRHQAVGFNSPLRGYGVVSLSGRNDPASPARPGSAPRHARPGDAGTTAPLRPVLPAVTGQRTHPTAARASCSSGASRGPAPHRRAAASRPGFSPR